MDCQPNAEFVQIVNVKRNHWILISTVNCPLYTVDIYDSMHLSLSTRMKKPVADLLQAPSKEITTRYRVKRLPLDIVMCSGSQEAVTVVFLQWPLQQAFVMALTQLQLPSLSHACGPILCSALKRSLCPCSRTSIEHGSRQPKQAVQNCSLSFALANYQMMEQQWWSVVRAQSGTM